MMEHNIVCIACPVGCRMTITGDTAHTISVTGNACNRGKTYAISEQTNPVRIVTSLVSVAGRRQPVSVKTREGIPKGKIFAILEEIRTARVTPPIRTGDVIIRNVCNTGVDVIATSILSQ